MDDSTSRRIFVATDLAAREMEPEEEMIEELPEGTPRPKNKRPMMRMPLLPEGVFAHDWYGLLRWDAQTFADMIRNFNEGVLGFCPMLNYDHSSHNWSAATAPAAGWCEKLEHAAGQGLDMVCSLTPRGVQAIDDEEYRYISAEVADSWTTSEGRTYANVIVGAALTNTPFHDTMRGLFSRSQTFSLAGRRYLVAGLNEEGESARRRAGEWEERLKDALGQREGARRAPGLLQDLRQLVMAGDRQRGEDGR